VRELREKTGWTQEELSVALDKRLGRTAGQRATWPTTISKWERGVEAPSTAHRLALAKIAAKYGDDDLVRIFRAKISRQ
jgi:transcriptional regulator with XRE-family HTH domain